MPLVFLTPPGTRASLVSERLPVELPASNGDTEPPAPRDIPLFDVEQIVADERVQLTTPALCEGLRRSIPVIFLARNQSVLGLCQPPAPAATVRHTQHQRVADAGFTLAVAATLVEGKIQNCRRVLQRSVTTSSSPPNTSSDGGCFLNLDGRRRFFTAYERRLEREFTSEQHGTRTSLRGELRRQVQNLKRTLVTNDAFEPLLVGAQG